MWGIILYLYALALLFCVLEGRVGIISLPFGRKPNGNSLHIRGGVAKGDSVKSSSNEETDVQDKRKEFFILRENALGGGDDDDDRNDIDQDKDDDEEDEDDASDETEDDTISEEVETGSMEMSPFHDQLKDIWKTFLHPAPKLSELLAALKSQPSNNTEDTMYRQLLGQFIDPFAVGGKKVLWLDQETVLRLKGAAVLSLNPQLLPINITSPSNDDTSSAKTTSLLPPKGVRVTIAPAFPSYTAGGAGGYPLEGTQTVQSALVKALCHSVGSGRVSLTRDNVNSVRQLAVEQGASEPIADHHVVMALLDALSDATPSSQQQQQQQQKQTPYTVVLQNEELSSWLSRDPFTARVLSSAFGSDSAAVSTSTSPPPSSRLFFMVLPDQAPLTVGQVPPSLHVPTPSTQQGQQGQEDNDSPMQQFFGASFQPTSPNPQFGSPFVPPQFQSMDPSSNGGPIPMYTVVVTNGSARVIPTGPPHLLPPPPPPEVIQRLVNEAMKKVPEHRRGASFLGSLYARVSPEEARTLTDESKKLKSIRDRLLKQKAELEAASKEAKNVLKSPIRARMSQFTLTHDNATTQTTSGKSETKPSAAASASPKPDVDNSAVILARSFEEIIVRPPGDHQLKVKWEKMVDEEMSRRIGKVNKNTLRSELRRCGLQTAPGVVRALREVLRRQVLSEEEVRSAIRLAVKLQAGRYNVTAVLMQSRGVDAEDGSSTGTSESEGVSASVEASTAAAATATAGAVTSAQPTASASEMLLSYWSLETALSMAVNAATTIGGGGSVQPGRRRLLPVQLSRSPRSRSTEEINALIGTLDKHEKALVSNVISPQEIGVTYDMIGGLESVKEILRQSITYPLKYPKLYEEGVASEAVKGVLLFGPPGTGKTMLAKAVATEGGATFLTIDAATIENKWLGESEKNAKAVFSLARRLAPCVIYLDEVDSVLSSRESGDDSSHGTLTAVKTTLMQEWDGLRTTKDRVVVIASTNRPFDLDEAVLRRLPRRIMVDLPDLETRREILAVTLRDNRIAAEVNLTVLAEQLEGYTGSDIKEVCREAVVRVSHERAHKLEMGLSDSSGGGDTLDFDESTAPLREVTSEDFRVAMTKLKASVSESGRELKKVLEWNEKFGEVKKSNKRRPSSSSQLSMYV